MKTILVLTVLGLAGEGAAAHMPAECGHTPKATPAIVHVRAEAPPKAGPVQERATRQGTCVEIAAVKNHDDLMKAAGPRFAGMWIGYDRANQAHQVIAVTGPVNFQSRSLVLADNGLVVVRVRYSLADLDKIRDAVFGHFNAMQRDGEPWVFGVATDEINNRLSVRARLHNRNFILAQIRAAGIDLRAVVVEHQDGPVNLFYRSSVSVGEPAEAAPKPTLVH